jgi:predicted metal-binding protein
LKLSAVDELIAEALASGFDHAAELNMGALEFLPEVREMCAADRCGSFGKCWTCPPGCGTLEEIKEKASRYKRGLLLQSTGRLEDDFDIETMEEVEKRHRESFLSFVRKIRKRFPGALPMGSGGCRICADCTYPDSPCRYPELAFPSMEAYGLFVSRVCEKSGLPYYYGKRTITYTACILLD